MRSWEEEREGIDCGILGSGLSQKHFLKYFFEIPKVAKFSFAYRDEKS